MLTTESLEKWKADNPYKKFAGVIDAKHGLIFVEDLPRDYREFWIPPDPIKEEVDEEFEESVRERKQEAKEKRMNVIVKLYNLGYSQSFIASHLRLPQPTVQSKLAKYFEQIRDQQK